MLNIPYLEDSAIPIAANIFCADGRSQRSHCRAADVALVATGFSGVPESDELVGVMITA